ncbi:MAG: hypothetical protein U9N49_07560 [Campylobacterota bacterium]|nr:hypothetical protein [Campylobacterota bacterium]
MKGVPLQEAKNSMVKMGKYFFDQGDKIALVVAVDKCRGGTRIATKFFDNIRDLQQAINKIKPKGNHNITLGFDYAQKQMKKHRYSGHIYMFGDCDGLHHCQSIETLANQYKRQNALTPFTYLQVEGCTKDEKLAWKETLKRIGGSTGVADIFNYQTIVNKKRLTIKKQQF